MTRGKGIYSQDVGGKEKRFVFAFFTLYKIGLGSYKLMGFFHLLLHPRSNAKWVCGRWNDKASSIRCRCCCKPWRWRHEHEALGLFTKRSQHKQVLLELIRNALDAMGEVARHLLALGEIAARFPAMIFLDETLWRLVEIETDRRQSWVLLRVRDGADSTDRDKDFKVEAIVDNVPHKGFLDRIVCAHQVGVHRESLPRTDGQCCGADNNFLQGTRSRSSRSKCTTASRCYWWW